MALSWVYHLHSALPASSEQTWVRSRQVCQRLLPSLAEVLPEVAAMGPEGQLSYLEFVHWSVSNLDGGKQVREGDREGERGEREREGGRGRMGWFFCKPISCALTCICVYICTYVRYVHKCMFHCVYYTNTHTCTFTHAHMYMNTQFIAYIASHSHTIHTLHT